MTQNSEQQPDETREANEPVSERKKLLDARYFIVYRIELSNIYHRKRERFYDMLDRTGKATAIVAGSAAIVRLSPDAWWVPWIAALVAASSACSLVWAFSERARKHGELARQFCELGARIARVADGSVTAENIAEWDADERLLGANEPASLRALVLICQNQMAVARKETVYYLHPFKRLTAQLYDWDVQAVPITAKSGTP